MSSKAFDLRELQQALHLIREHGHFGTAGPLQVQDLRLGLVHSCEELFITSKLWCTDAPWFCAPCSQEAPQVTNNIRFSLFLCVHTYLHICMFASYRLMGTDEGVVLADLQVEMNVAWNQQKLKGFCKREVFNITARQLLAVKGDPWGSLQWCRAQSAERKLLLLRLFLWELRREDVDKDQGHSIMQGISRGHVSLEELWDGERYILWSHYLFNEHENFCHLLQLCTGLRSVNQNKLYTMGFLAEDVD